MASYAKTFPRKKKGTLSKLSRRFSQAGGSWNAQNLTKLGSNWSVYSTYSQRSFRSEDLAAELWKLNAMQDQFHTFSIPDYQLTKIIEFLENQIADKSSNNNDGEPDALDLERTNFRMKFPPSMVFSLEMYYNMYVMGYVLANTILFLIMLRCSVCYYISIVLSIFLLTHA